MTTVSRVSSFWGISEVFIFPLMDMREFLIELKPPISRWLTSESFGRSCLLILAPSEIRFAYLKPGLDVLMPTPTLVSHEEALPE